MQHADRFGALERVGSKTISSKSVPVYRIADTEYVRVKDAITGHETLLTVEAATKFARNPCPLHEDLETVFSSVDKPFALLPEEEQHEAAAKMLRALMGRVAEAGINYKFCSN